MCIIKNKSTKKIAKVTNRTRLLFHSILTFYPDIFPITLDYYRVNNTLGERKKYILTWNLQFYRKGNYDWVEWSENAG